MALKVKNDVAMNDIIITGANNTFYVNGLIAVNPAANTITYPQLTNCFAATAAQGFVEREYIKSSKNYIVDSNQKLFSIVYDDTVVPNIWGVVDALNFAKRACGSIGTVFNALCVGGINAVSDPTIYKNHTEMFDGSVWTMKAGLGTARYGMGACGISTAAIIFAGANAAALESTELFNGLVWSTGVTTTVARYFLGACGVQNNCIGFAGWNGAVMTTTQKFNGTAWSTEGVLASGRFRVAAAGVTAAALCIGGATTATPTNSANTYTFNGSTWAVSASIPTATSALAANGSLLNAVYYGGFAAAMTAVTGRYNGTTWAVLSATLSVARDYIAGTGSTGNSALSFGGGGSTQYATTEIFRTYVREDVVLSTHDLQGTDTWSATGSVNTARGMAAGMGSQNAGVFIGGYIEPDVDSNKIEKFNGSIWSESSATLATARNALSGVGIQNNAMVFGGTDINSVLKNSTEVFNGLTISAGGTLNTARYYSGSAGIVGTAVTFGGIDSNGDNINTTELYNTSTWSTSGNLNTTRMGLGGCGRQTAALSFGGQTGAGDSYVTEKFNGTSWSTTGNLNVVTRFSGSAGTQNTALAFSGNEITSTEKFNGTTWAITGCTTIARSIACGAGTQNAALCMSGSLGASPYQTAVCEKFNGNVQVKANAYYIDNSYTHYEVSNASSLSFSSAALLAVDYNICGNNNDTELADLTYLGRTYADNYWVATVSLNTNRSNFGVTGVQNSAVAFGGRIGTSTNTNITEKFNGSAWSNSGNVAVAKRGMGAAGVQNAALCAAGYTTVGINVIERYNGVHWSLSTAVYVSATSDVGCDGIYNSALIYGGGVSSNVTSSQWFNGLTVTTIGTALSRRMHASVGCVNNNLGIGGFTTVATNQTQQFNGTAWTTLAATLNVARYLMGASGLANTAHIFGGQTGTSTYTNTTEVFNGTVWSLFNIINATRFAIGGCGSQNSALCAGGQTDSSTFLGTVEKSTPVRIPSKWNYGITVTGKNIAAI
jgi:hypothetical protein